jgi:hypothetical protein
MKQQSKLTSLEQQQHISLEKTEVKSGREFANVEEMLRHDAAQTSVPSTVMGRLRRSVEREPKPARSWWQRFLGGGH